MAIRRVGTTFALLGALVVSAAACSGTSPTHHDGPLAALDDAIDKTRRVPFRYTTDRNLTSSGGHLRIHADGASDPRIHVQRVDQTSSGHRITYVYGPNWILVRSDDGTWTRIDVTGGAYDYLQQHRTGRNTLIGGLRADATAIHRNGTDTLDGRPVSVWTGGVDVDAFTRLLVDLYGTAPAAADRLRSSITSSGTDITGTVTFFVDDATGLVRRAEAKVTADSDSPVLTIRSDVTPQPLDFRVDLPAGNTIKGHQTVGSKAELRKAEQAAALTAGA